MQTRVFLFRLPLYLSIRIIVSRINMEFLKTHRKYLALLLLAFIIMLFFYGRIDYSSDSFRNWDLKHYDAMAEAAPAINHNIPQPFAFRILGPILAGLMPFQTDFSFYILSLIAVLSLLILLYYYLIEHGVSCAIALVITVALLCNPYFIGLNIWDYFQLNDTLALLTILLAYIFIEKHQWFYLAVTLALGALARETWILIVPAGYMLLFQSRFGRCKFLPYTLSIFPAIIIAIIIRIYIDPVGGHSLPDAFKMHAEKLFHPGPWGGLTINSILPLTPIPLIFYNRAFEFLRSRPDCILIYILVFISALFGSDNERLMAPAFIAIYPLAGYLLTKIAFRGRIFTGILLLLIFLNSFHLIYGRYTFPDETTMKLVRLGLLAATFILFLFFKGYRSIPRSDESA